MAKRALIYTRVSQDRAGGRSPQEQERECRAECARHEWEVIEPPLLDTVGASRKSKGKREGWARVLDLIATGGVDVLVTWEASRAQRDLAAYVALEQLCQQYEVEWSYKGRLHDLNSSSDSFMTALDALLAQKEADDISDRVRRAMRASAQQGRPPGRRLFGYERVYDGSTPPRLVGQVPHLEEAKVVRQIFDEFVGGRGLRTIARELNAEGITTGLGKPWADSQVRRVLCNPHYAGRRVHRGEVIGEAAWEPLVDAARFDQVQARLEAGRAVPRSRKTARLLTGVGRCGKCGGKVNAQHDRNKRKVYVCRAGFCVGRDLTKLDDFVTAVVLERLARPDVREALAAKDDGLPEDPAAVELAVLHQRLDDAVRAYTDGKIDVATLASIEGDLKIRITAKEREIRQALVPLHVEVPATDLRGWWDDLPPEVRREIIGTLLAAVVINPAVKGSRTFDPKSVEIHWRR